MHVYITTFHLWDVVCVFTLQRSGAYANDTPRGGPVPAALGRIKSNAGLVGASIKGRWLLYRLKIIRRIIILYQKLQRT